MFDSLITFAQESQSTGSSFVETVFWVASIVGLWKMLEKADEPGWPALIPFYDHYKMCQVCMGDPWYWLRLFVFVIPVVGWIAGFYFMYQMYRAVARSYGKPDAWAWGLIFLAPVFKCMLGFSQDVSYYGPMGVNDRRSSQAREAKTVNFDVVKDAPQQSYQNRTQQTRVEAAPEAKPEAKEETVDFTFDQPEE